MHNYEKLLQVFKELHNVLTVKLITIACCMIETRWHSKHIFYHPEDEN